MFDVFVVQRRRRPSQLLGENSNVSDPLREYTLSAWELQANLRLRLLITKLRQQQQLLLHPRRLRHLCRLAPIMDNYVITIIIIITGMRHWLLLLMQHVVVVV